MKKAVSILIVFSLTLFLFSTYVFTKKTPASNSESLEKKEGMMNLIENLGITLPENTEYEKVNKTTTGMYSIHFTVEITPNKTEKQIKDWAASLLEYLKEEKNWGGQELRTMFGKKLWLVRDKDGSTEHLNIKYEKTKDNKNFNIIISYKYFK